jgi:hypothetical protein
MATRNVVLQARLMIGYARARLSTPQTVTIVVQCILIASASASSALYLKRSLFISFHYLLTLNHVFYLSTEPEGESRYRVVYSEHIYAAVPALFAVASNHLYILLHSSLFHIPSLRPENSDSVATQRCRYTRVLRNRDHSTRLPYRKLRSRHLSPSWAYS